jgi:hypothetical protein
MSLVGSITIRNIDSDLKREFKIACLVRDRTMSEVLITLMKEYIDKPDGGERTRKDR